MLAITIKQPWAEFIVAGIKRVENRTWKAEYKGALLIHAANTWDNNWKNKIKERTRQVAEMHLARERIKRFGALKLPRQAVVGVVLMTGCDRECNNEWCMPGMWYHRYSFAERLSPLKMPGRVKLFNVKLAETSKKNLAMIEGVKTKAVDMGFFNI